MNLEFLKLKKSLEELNFFNKKSSEVFLLNFLKDKKNYTNTFEKTLKILNNLEFCSKCHSLKSKDECENCKVNSETIYLFEDLSDYFYFLEKIDEIQKVYILSSFKKSDYLKEDKLKEEFNNFISFLDNKKVKKIIFMLSPSYENEIFKRYFKNNIIKIIKYNLLFKEIPLGLPLNSKLKYYDANLIKNLIDKNE